MVYENNIPKTETVYELKNEIPSFEEFMRNWKKDKGVSDSYDLESEDQTLYGPQYGPSGRKKKKKLVKVNGKFEEHWIDTLNNVAGESSDFWDIDESADKSDDWHAFHFETSAGASAGAGGMIAGGGASASVFRYSDSGGDLKFGNASIGGEIGAGAGLTAKYSAGIDAVNVHTKHGIRANVGLDVGSGGSIGPTGVEVKVAGFGIDVGKKIGFSTPLGGASVDLEEACVVQ